MDNDILDLWTKADRLTTTEVRVLLEHIQGLRHEIAAYEAQEYNTDCELAHKDLRDLCSPTS